MPKSTKSSAAAKQRKKVSDMVLPRKQLRRWAFTVSCEKMTKGALIGHLKGTKRWTFQQEKSETGYLHFQGRVSFKNPIRANEVKWIHGAGHLSIESNVGGKMSEFYAQKDETRVDGPWTDKDQPDWIPDRLVGMELRPWQKEMVDLLLADQKDVWSRKVRYIVDTTGGIGKSILGIYLRVYHKAIVLPSTLVTSEDIMQAMCAKVGNSHDARIVVVDFPRATALSHWRVFAAALENIKNGTAYDKRYSWKEAHFNPPAMLCVCNQAPPLGVFSKDRWERFFPERF